MGQRLLENAILPYNRQEVLTDRTDKELLQVFEETGENVLPSVPSKDLTINKEKYRLSSTEYNQAKENFGNTSKKLLNDLLNSSNYSKLTAEGRAKAISDVYSYAKEKLKKEYADSIGQEIETSKMYNTVTNLEKANADVSAYFEFQGKLDDLDRQKGDENIKTKEKLDYLNEMKTNDKTKRIIYEDTFGTTDKTYRGLKALTNNKVTIKDYLGFKTADLSAEKEDDGTKAGKTISGSAKEKVINYINNSNFTGMEKLYLYGTKYKLNSSERRDLQNYIKGLGLTKTEQEEIYKSLASSNIVEMKDGRIMWKN